MRTAVAALLGVAIGCRGGWARADADFGADLAALGRASSRPEECGGASRSRVSRWDRAKTPGLGPYCDALSRGYAVLGTKPADAAESAARAESTLAGHVAPTVLLARAQLRLGKDAEARTLFERALALSPKSLDAPGALHDYAVSEVRTGNHAAALVAYRTLVPRAELLGDRREEVFALVEAAAVVMTEGKASLSEAVGYLVEARRRSPPLLRSAVLGALALALDRAGRASEAAAVAVEAGSASYLEAERTAEHAGHGDGLTLPAGEREAIIGIVLERTDRETAAERFRESVSLETPWSGPFIAHSKKHADALSRSHP